MKKVIAMIMSLVLILSLVPTAFADEKVAFAVDEVSCSVEAGTTVDVAIKITKNPGIVGFSFDVNFDKDSLKLTAVNDAGSIMTAGGAAYAGQGKFPVETGKYGVAFDGDLLSANITATGEVVVLKFEVIEGATAGKKDITLTKIDSTNFDLDDLGGEAVNGSITLIGNTPAHEHVWSEAWSKDATHHWHDCTAAGCDAANADKNGYAAHNYNKKVTTKDYLKTAANCTDAAVYYYSCECGAIGTKTFTDGTALGHVQASPWAHNDTEHWQVCTRCSKDFHKAPHNGGTATCKEMAKCEICGAAYGKLGEHNFDTKWTSDDTYHYHKCLTAGCTEKADDAAKHSSTGANEANCLHKAKCDVCAAEYGNLGAHTLTKTAAKAPTCLEAGNNEYYTCSVCGKVFKDAAGTTETTVAAETLAKSTTHVVESKYATSATEHWQICKVCGTVVGKAAHKFGEADANGRKTCADCGYTVGGTGTEGHKHAAGNTICYDENNHWNKCTDDNCDAHVNESAHKFGPKNTVTEGNKTITIETCSECGYVKRTETTTGGTTPVNPGGNKPTKPGTKDNGKTVQSGKTFDAGVGVYVGLSILSLTGSAVVIGKKRKTR